MGRHLAPHKPSLPNIREGLTKRAIATLADQSVGKLLDEGAFKTSKSTYRITLAR